MNQANPCPSYEKTADGQHRYLSTGCYHGHHDYCQAVTGHAGPKVPATCKFCAAPCVCACHQDQP